MSALGPVVPQALPVGKHTTIGRLPLRVPVNLKGMVAPRGVVRTPASAAGTSRAYTRRIIQKAAAGPPAPQITSSPTNSTYVTSATFAFTDTATGVSFQCRLDAAVFTACTSPVTYAGPLALGNHTFRVRAASASGTSATTQFSWQILAPPAPTLESTPAASTADATATFAFTDSLDGVAFECRLDGASFSACTSPAQYGPLPAGSHTFRVRARDAAGTGAATVFTWTITRTPAPTLTGSPTNPTTERSASFAFADEIVTATFQCRLDGAAYAACTSPVAYTGPLAYGTHTFRVTAVTASGTSAATTYTWSVVPPTPTITSGPPSSTSSTSAAFVFSDSTTGLKFVCRVDAAAFASCTSPKTYTGVTPGAHTFEVRAVSSNGTQSASATYGWTVLPAPPPSPTITSQPSDPSNSAAASFAFTDTDTSAAFECSLDSAAFATCTSPASYSGLANGSHTFQVRATNAGGASAPAAYTWSVDIPQVKARLLVISGNGAEQYDFASNSACSPNPCKGAIQTYLDELGVPYDTMIASQVDPATLADTLGLNGSTGNYDGIILATGDLGYTNSSGSYVSGFNADEWQTLWAYEAKFGVRQVTSDTAPVAAPDSYGLTSVGAGTDPVTATLTAAGKQVFSYLNPDVQISNDGAYTYLATTSDPSVTPLLTTSDGYVIASTRTYSDGRENLAVTWGNAPWLLHTKLLSYGIVNWVTDGVFLGSRHVTMDAEIDDLLIDGDLWDPTTHTELADDAPGGTDRMTAADFSNLASWQNGIRSANPNLSQFRLEFAFNGEGAFGDPPAYDKLDGSASVYPNDDLTPAVVAGQSNFCFVNHTYTHANLDSISYADAITEIQDNQKSARALGLGCYDDSEFVQPDISGLANANFLSAAWDSGIRTMVTDTSQPGWNNPTPNAGFVLGTADKPLLAIPRHPTNLFWNLETKEQWVDEYNWTFCLCSPSTSPWKFWPVNQTYDQIIDHESDFLLGYLLTWDIDPWMFHQLNAIQYDDAGHTLLGDLLEATIAKYNRVYNLPVLNKTQQQVGDLMRQRMAYDASGVSATVVPCQSMTISVQQAADVPVTGVTGGTTETYGGQPISTIHVTPGSPVTVPISCS